MTIKLLANVGHWIQHQVVDVPDKQGEKLIRQGYAVLKRRRGRPPKVKD